MTGSVVTTNEETEKNKNNETTDVVNKPEHKETNSWTWATAIDISWTGITTTPTNLSGSTLEEFTEIIKANVNDKNAFESLTKKRMELISNLNNTALENKIKELESIVKQKEIEVGTLEKINSEFKEKIKSLEASWESKTAEMQSEIDKYKLAIKQNNEKLSTIEAERINTTLILENLAKVQSELDKKEDNIFKAKIYNILSILSVLWLFYIISILIYKHYRKKLSANHESHKNIGKIVARMNVVSVATTIAVGIVLAFSVIYLKPELAVWFLFFGSAFILIFKDLILSFIASIFVMVKYNIWDDIIYDSQWVKANGRITKLTPLFIVIREIDWDIKRDTFSWRIINIPNKVVFEAWVIKNSNNYSDFFRSSFDFVVKLTDSESNNDYRRRVVEKMNEIEHYLEEVLEALPTREKGLYGNINSKYTKNIFYKEKEYIVRYEWIEPAWFEENIKEFMFDVIMKE